MLNQVRGQHKEWEPETVVGTGLGRDDLTERSSDVFIGEGSLGDGLRENWVGAGDAGSDDEGGEEGELGNGDHDAGGCAEPHDGHDGEKTEGHFLPSCETILGGELIACDDQLYTNHDTSETLWSLA
jgi:hypothetical protein